MSMFGTQLVVTVSGSTTHHVYPGQSIQQAIDSAQPGDTIVVHAGKYYEDWITVYKSNLTLLGENGKSIIDGDGSWMPVVHIQAENVNITGFTIQNGGNFGFRLHGAKNCFLSNNNITGNKYNFGIYGSEAEDFFHNIEPSNLVDGKPIYYWVNQKAKQIPADAGFVAIVNSSEITVANLSLTKNEHGVLFVASNNSTIYNLNASNNGNGLSIKYSRDIVMIGNNLSNNSRGILLRDSANCALKENSIASASWQGFGVWGSSLSHFLHDIDTSNRVDGKLVYYLINRSNVLVDSVAFPDVGYLAVVNSSKVTIRDLNLTNANGQGVLLAYTNDSTVRNVNSTGNWEGVYLQEAVNNTICHNLVSDSKDCGIVIRGGNDNIILNNVVRKSGFTGGVEGSGISLESDSNLIGSNILSNNAYGIGLVSGERNFVTDNRAFNNWGGISLFIGAHNNTIACNNVLDNDNGFYMSYGGYENTIVQNIIQNNGKGIYGGYNNRDNLIYQNDFLYNGEHIFSYASLHQNSWDNGTFGNYWSDYEDRYPDAQEIDGSGIWNTPYEIDENNQDNYPLMNPWSLRQKVTITGRFHYFDNQNNSKPVDRATVELYDEDSGLDNLLDSTYTTSEGYFVLGPVENVDDELGESGTRDLYIKAYAENWAGKVRESSFIVVPYEFSTTTVWDVPDGQHDWGSMPVPEEQYPVFFILDTIILGYDYVHSFVDSFSASVDVVWHEGYEGPLSQGTNYHPPTDTVHLSGEFHNPDQWDDGIILHEYGHFVADKLDIMAWYNVTGEHEWNGTYSAQLAWSEGWAHFFSCAARESPTYRNTFPYDIWSEFNVETGTLTNDLGKIIDANAYGGSCEASVAGIIWDIFDGGVDTRDDQDGDGIRDNLDYKEDAIWDVVLYYSTGGLLPHKVYTIFDFWDGWFARGHGYHQEMWNIYYEHGETMPAPEHTLTFNFTFGEETYHVVTFSNSSVTDLYFNPDDGAFIKFNVTGPTGTTGFCNVTIPDDLLWGNFSVYKDGILLVEDIDYTQTYNGTHYIFHITYTHSPHMIEIKSTEVIPEFPTWTSILLILIVLTVAIAIYERRLLKTSTH